MSINLHELANTPFAGNAEKVLRSEGKWDDARILDGTSVFRITVKVSGTYLPMVVSETFTVEAATEGEAISEAEALSDFYEIDDSEIVSMTRLGQ
jgi:hypothetical protein